MSIKVKIIIGFISFIFGILTGVIIILALGKLPLPIDNIIYKTLGIYKPKIIGFQPYWLLEKTGKNYDQHITTLTYFGLVLNSNGTVQKLINLIEEEPGWTTLKSKLNKPDHNEVQSFSLLVHNSNEEEIAELIKNPEENARNLISDVSPIMLKYGFNDLNLDIESFLEVSKEKQLRFTSFIKEVKKSLDKNKLGTLTVEISPTSLVKNFLTNPEDIGKIANYVVFMAYDYHYLGSYVAGPVAPIGGAGKISEFDVETGIKEGLKIIPAEKIILGVPLYGYEWETLSNNPGAPTIPLGGSTASNKRVAKLLTECPNCKMGVNQKAQENYVIFPDPQGKFYHQIFYSDQNSLTQKIELAKKYKIGGIALWALGYEEEKMIEPLKDYKQSFKWNW